MNIERVGDRHPIGQQFPQRAAWSCGMGAKSRSSVRATSAVIAMSPPDAPMISTLRPASAPPRVEQLEGLAQTAERVAAREPGLPAECIEYAVRARERARVAVRRARRRGGAAGFDDGDGLAGAARLVRGARETLGVLDPFEIQAERGDARILAENLDEILDREAASDCRPKKDSRSAPSAR